MHNNGSRRCSRWLGASWSFLDDDLYLCMRIQRPEFDDTEGYEVKKLSGGPRFCRMCRGYKPPRAHHCKTCKKCVSVNCIPPLSEYTWLLADACFAWVSMQ